MGTRRWTRAMALNREFYAACFARSALGRSVATETKSSETSFSAAAKKEFSMVAFLKDLAVGGVSGSIAKTATAPIERVKLLIQTQDANPRIMSGEVPRYTGILNCFTRVSAEQGVGSFWRGNTANIVRYFPTQAFNFAFKDTIKNMFPSYSPKDAFWSFFAVNMASGGLAGAGSLLIVYPLDFARTRLAADVGSNKTREFTGLVDCLTEIASRSGPLALYQGFGVSVQGIIVYRGSYFGLYDTGKGALLTKDSSIVAKFVVAQAPPRQKMFMCNVSPASNRCSSSSGRMDYPLRLKSEGCPRSPLGTRSTRRTNRRILQPARGAGG